MTATTETPPPRIRESSLSLYHLLDPGVSYEKWSHLWQGSPLYRELQKCWSIGWVLEDEDGKIVGSMANIPVSYEFEGKRILGRQGAGEWSKPNTGQPR